MAQDFKKGSRLARELLGNGPLPPSTASLWIAIQGGRCAIGARDRELGHRCMTEMDRMRGRELVTSYEQPLTDDYIRAYPDKRSRRDFEARRAAGETHVSIGLGGVSWDERADEDYARLAAFV